MSDLNKILSDRGARYGSFADVAKTTMMIQCAMQGNVMRDYQEAALQMIASKLARIAHGDPDYINSWVDIAGYAQLVVNELKAESLKRGGEQ